MSVTPSEHGCENTADSSFVGLFRHERSGLGNEVVCVQEDYQAPNVISPEPQGQTQLHIYNLITFGVWAGLFIYSLIYLSIYLFNFFFLNNIYFFFSSS